MRHKRPKISDGLLAFIIGAFVFLGAIVLNLAILAATVWVIVKVLQTMGVL